jgi:hypothetical protein
VERSPAKLAGVQWRAAATIVRTDTDEPVQRLAGRGATAADADAQLAAAIAATLAALTPPADWGRDPTVPHLIQRYLQLRDEVYGMVERGAPDAGDRDRRGLAALQAQVEALTDAQLVELATPTADQLAAIADPYVQDVLAAKHALAQFITRRSAAVQAGADRLAAALGA